MHTLCGKQHNMYVPADRPTSSPSPARQAASYPDKKQHQPADRPTAAGYLGGRPTLQGRSDDDTDERFFHCFWLCCVVLLLVLIIQNIFPCLLCTAFLALCWSWSSLPFRRRSRYVVANSTAITRWYVGSERNNNHSKASVDDIGVCSQ